MVPKPDEIVVPNVKNEIYTRTFPLLHESDPILTQEPKPWIFGENPDPQRMRMIMLENMVAHKGLGLSANQIGMPVQVFAMYVTDQDGIVCFNPKIVGESDESVIMKEGCLSFPELYLKIKRPREIWVKYQNADGDIINAHFEDLAARIFHHEMDHLNGKTFFERANFLHKEKGLKKLKKYSRMIKKVDK
jgi:peptide deformylase